MAAGADAQVGVGLADVEVGEEAVGHGGVVVLAGVDQRDVLIAAAKACSSGATFTKFGRVAAITTGRWIGVFIVGLSNVREWSGG